MSSLGVGYEFASHSKAATEIISPRESEPGVPGSTRTMDRPCVMRQYCRIGGICLTAARASGSPLGDYVIASLRFCVLEHPSARYESTPLLKNKSRTMIKSDNVTKGSNSQRF